MYLVSQNYDQKIRLNKQLYIVQIFDDFTSNMLVLLIGVILICISYNILLDTKQNNQVLTNSIQDSKFLYLMIYFGSQKDKIDYSISLLIFLGILFTSIKIGILLIKYYLLSKIINILADDITQYMKISNKMNDNFDLLFKFMIDNIYNYIKSCHISAYLIGIIISGIVFCIINTMLLTDNFIDFSLEIYGINLLPIALYIYLSITILLKKYQENTKLKITMNKMNIEFFHTIKLDRSNRKANIIPIFVINMVKMIIYLLLHSISPDISIFMFLILLISNLYIHTNSYYSIYKNMLYEQLFHISLRKIKLHEPNIDEEYHLAIKCNDITIRQNIFKFSSYFILKNINLEVKVNEKIVIHGLSGKSKIAEYLSNFNDHNLDIQWKYTPKYYDINFLNATPIYERVKTILNYALNSEDQIIILDNSLIDILLLSDKLLFLNKIKNTSKTIIIFSSSFIKGFTNYEIINQSLKIM